MKCSLVVIALLGVFFACMLYVALPYDYGFDHSRACNETGKIIFTSHIDDHSTKIYHYVRTTSFRSDFVQYCMDNTVYINLNTRPSVQTLHWGDQFVYWIPNTKPNNKPWEGYFSNRPERDD
jgi:hypothetical protein